MLRLRLVPWGGPHRRERAGPCGGRFFLTLARAGCLPVSLSRARRFVRITAPTRTCTERKWKRKISYLTARCRCLHPRNYCWKRSTRGRRRICRRTSAPVGSREGETLPLLLVCDGSLQLATVERRRDGCRFFRRSKRISSRFEIGFLAWS